MEEDQRYPISNSLTKRLTIFSFSIICPFVIMIFVLAYFFLALREDIRLEREKPDADPCIIWAKAALHGLPFTWCAYWLGRTARLIVITITRWSSDNSDDYWELALGWKCAFFLLLTLMILAIFAYQGLFLAWLFGVSNVFTLLLYDWCLFNLKRM